MLCSNCKSRQAVYRVNGLPFCQSCMAAKEACPNCQTTSYDLASKAKAGCSICYEKLRSDLKGICESMQGSSEHIDERKEVLADLEAKLELALRQEDYLEAARLRDRIWEIKK